jgi:hypothetical protein
MGIQSHISHTKDRRRSSPREREIIGREIEKLKELYQKLSFCQHYPKDSLKLLIRSADMLEVHLLNRGVTKVRITTLLGEDTK